MSSSAYQRSYRERHTDRSRARHAVAYAVRKGKLPRASSCLCGRCGQPAAHYHHRNGYEKAFWLDVEPVCVECHNIIDRIEPLSKWRIPEDEFMRPSYAELPDDDRGAPGFIERLENTAWLNGRIWQGDS